MDGADADIILHISMHDSMGISNSLNLSLHCKWLVSDLATAIESQLHEKGCNTAISLIVNPARDCVVPLGNTLEDSFNSGDHVIALGDVRAFERTQEITLTETSNVPNLIPVTILTGFLGSGKTTVLNHLLHEQQERRVAVIENEFGEVPIDNELLASKMELAESMVVMDNGCMCCSVRGDLLGAFMSILSKMDPRRPLDAVLVETTGMADPVPIVRTFLQTPEISSKFKLDGVVTMVDCKNVRPRLDAIEKSAAKNRTLGEKGSDEVDEAFQQIMFADRIIMNKVDLVSASSAIAVWMDLRALNRDAKILTCTRGQLKPSELTGFGAFNMRKMLLEDPDFCTPEPSSNQHHHHHHHHHHCSEDQCKEAFDCGDGCKDSNHDHHEHQHTHDHHQKKQGGYRHSSAVGTFSLVRDCKEVESLVFSRWLRVLALMKPENGILYRCKAILAVAGSSRKMAFHAVSDVMEKSMMGKWGPNEQKGCKIVFIGRNLNRKFLETGFDDCLRDTRVKTEAQKVPELLPCLTSILSLSSLTCIILGYLSSKDACQFGLICRRIYHLVFHNFDHNNEMSMGMYGRHEEIGFEGIYVHTLINMPSIKVYVDAFKQSNVKLPADGLTFNSQHDIEAFGVTLLELAEFKPSDVKNYIVEFKWRPEVIAQFMATPGSSTSSSLIRLDYEYYDKDDPDGDICDTLKFRLVLKPCSNKPEDSKGEKGKLDWPMELNELVIQTVGGRSCSQVYQCSFHSINPTFQVHTAVEDHRQPWFETKQAFHPYHPLMSALQRDNKLRFLVRLKPDGSGPLDNMCGCC